MQYDDVTTNPIWRTAAILKIVFWLYLRDAPPIRPRLMARYKCALID